MDRKRKIYIFIAFIMILALMTSMAFAVDEEVSEGAGSASYEIVPKGTAISKLTASTGAFKAAWAAQSAGITGYQLQYCTSRDFRSGAKTLTIKGYSKKPAISRILRQTPHTMSA